MLQEQRPQQSQEPQQAPQPVAARPNSSIKWIVLAVVGGGCVLIACAGLIVILAFRYFQVPAVGRVSQQVIATMDVAASTPVQIEPGVPATVTVAQAANTMGDPNAPVKIIEYADFQCPYCMHFSQDTAPQIVEQYVKTGKVFFEYRSVGAFLGPESGAAAQAAYCAGDQGKFWEYHDALFSHWTGENVGDFTNDKLAQYADALGLDAGAFGDCLKAGKYAARIEQDAKDAQTSGVQATPSFLINGKLLEGALPFTDFQQAIEAALQAK